MKLRERLITHTDENVVRIDVIVQQDFYFVHGRRRELKHIKGNRDLHRLFWNFDGGLIKWRWLYDRLSTFYDRLSTSVWRRLVPRPSGLED